MKTKTVQSTATKEITLTIALTRDEFRNLKIAAKDFGLPPTQAARNAVATFAEDMAEEARLGKLGYLCEAS